MKNNVIKMMLVIMVLCMLPGTPASAAKKKQKISAKNISVTVGTKKKSLKAKAKTKLTYKTSNKKIVTVDSKGRITAKKVGTAKITIKAKKTKKYKSAKKVIKVTVKKKHTHKWTEVLKKVKHEELGHYETKVIQEGQIVDITEWHTFCDGCGDDLNGLGDEEIQTHLTACNSTSSKKQVTVGKEKEPDVTENVWVVDEAAYTEILVTGYKCSCGSKKTKSTATPHKHKWEAVTGKVKHPEEGHYETKVIQKGKTTTVTEYRTFCNRCGEDLTDLGDEGLTLHVVKICGSTYHTEPVTKEVKEPDVTKEVWVVDKKAYTETITTGYKCACGAKKDK